MKDSTKKYLKVSITLGAICGVSALLIGAVNLLTADTIKANENAAVVKGLQNVYPDCDDFGDKQVVDGKTYVVSYWIAKENGTEVGYVYRTSGKNSYGEITMLLGLSGEGSFGTMYLITNTESYAGTLVDNYVNPYNNGDDKDTAIDEVTCGATHGATLIKDMAYEAKADYVSRKGA